MMMNFFPPKRIEFLPLVAIHCTFSISSLSTLFLLSGQHVVLNFFFLLSFSRVSAQGFFGGTSHLQRSQSGVLSWLMERDIIANGHAILF